ncbi:MAG: GTPase Era [Clostridia bacterium]|nr:GTPase Era [Clostridia bacterium]
MQEKEYRSGFVTLCGRSNVGKSTLINAMVGEKVSIVSPRKQTTRSNLRGIVTRPEYQIVLVDTPGIHAAKTKLGEYMMKEATGAMMDVEAIVFMTDAAAGFLDGDRRILESLEQDDVPVFVAVNKIDAAHVSSVAKVCDALNAFPFVKQVVPISAKKGTGVKELEEMIAQELPEGPQYFPEDMITDQPERVIISELIREKALYRLHEEVPHGIGVEIIRMREREDGAEEIYANILCERQSHKRIIIGKNGSMLKEIGISARRDIELLLGTRVDLRLWVKVQEDWRNREGILRELGYREE